MDGGQGPIEQLTFASGATGAIMIGLSFLPLMGGKLANQSFVIGCLFMIPAALGVMTYIVMIIGEHLAEKNTRPPNTRSSSE